MSHTTFDKTPCVATGMPGAPREPDWTKFNLHTGSVFYGRAQGDATHTFDAARFERLKKTMTAREAMGLAFKVRPER